MIWSGLITIAILGAGLPARAEADKADRLNSRVHDVNDAAKKKGMMQVALHTVSVETGVPREQVDALHKRFPDTGPAGILISCVMADETKRPPEEFIKKHNSGDGWGRVASESRVPVEKLIERLDRLERAMTTGGDTRERDKRR
jgi:hypothetical protein